MVDFLPPYEDLTEEQDRALRHNGSLLVTGPPGSGKTVIALFRAYELKKKNRQIHIITYGNVLMAYITECLKQNDISNLNKMTFHKWFPKYYRRAYNKNPPKFDRFTFDWESIEKQMLESGFHKEFDQLIIDEAQDLPVQFLRVSPYISENVTVFADENQAIFENNSRIKDIEKSLSRFSPKHIQLKKNFRNTMQIASFAAFFKTKGIETENTEAPDRVGDLPLLCKMKNFDEQVNRVCSYMPIINAKNKTAGIFLPFKKDIEKWKNELTNRNKEITVQYYISGELKDGRYCKPPNFSKKGIFIVSDWTAKGLEFDYVFVPDMQKLKNTRDQIMRCYVAFSRAKDNLILMHSGSNIPEIIQKNLSNSQSDPCRYLQVEDSQVSDGSLKSSPLPLKETNKRKHKVSLKEFIDYCKCEMDEKNFLIMKKLFRDLLQDENDLYDFWKFEVLIVRKLPKNSRKEVLFLLKQYSVI